MLRYYQRNLKRVIFAAASPSEIFWRIAADPLRVAQIAESTATASRPSRQAGSRDRPTGRCAAPTGWMDGRPGQYVGCGHPQDLILTDIPRVLIPLDLIFRPSRAPISDILYSGLRANLHDKALRTLRVVRALWFVSVALSPLRLASWLIALRFLVPLRPDGSCCYSPR
jgi:hypothetical protein